MTTTSQPVDKWNGDNVIKAILRASERTSKGSVVGNEEHVDFLGFYRPKGRIARRDGSCLDV